MSEVYVIPEIVEKEDFNKYLSTRFRDAVIEFNAACGKNPLHIKDGDVAVDMVLNECKRVIEESDETIKGYLESYRKERLDGIVDTYWTATQLEFLLSTFYLNIKEEFLDALRHREYDKQLMITYAHKNSELAVVLGQGTIISAKAIMIAAERVIINNKMKYTDDVNKAQEWAKHLEDGQELKSYEFNGKTFYCIKRIFDDYIVKPYGFKPVDLGGI